MKKRMIFWLVLLTLTLTFAAAAKWQEYSFRGELTPLAERYAEDARKALSATALGADGYNITHEMTVSRQWLVTGPVTGKVTVYTQPCSAEGPQAIQVYEYHHTYEEGAWHRTDSAYCNDATCRVRGAELFASMAPRP